MKGRGDENRPWKRTKVPGDRPRPNPSRVHGWRFSPSLLSHLACARSTTSLLQCRRASQEASADANKRLAVLQCGDGQVVPDCSRALPVRGFARQHLLGVWGPPRARMAVWPVRRNDRSGVAARRHRRFGCHPRMSAIDARVRPVAQGGCEQSVLVVKSGRGGPGELVWYREEVVLQAALRWFAVGGERHGLDLSVCGEAPRLAYPACSRPSTIADT